MRDDELATRWVQLGVFSPILRLHSSSNPFLVKEPWLYPAESREAMTAALRFRHRLVPYLHTANHVAATEGTPLVRPMYHLEPEAQQAYTVPNQFGFGSELIVAPVTAPRDRVTLRGAVRAWLPAGTWIDIFTSTVYDGDREIELHRDSGSIPALLRAGGILPLASEDDLDATRNPERLELLVAPGADGAFTLIEDDGTGATPGDIPTARTRDPLGPGRRRADDRGARGPARRRARGQDVDGDAARGRPRVRCGSTAPGASRPAPTRSRARPTGPARCSRRSAPPSTGTRPRPPRGGR